MRIYTIDGYAEIIAARDSFDAEAFVLDNLSDPDDDTDLFSEEIPHEEWETRDIYDDGSVSGTEGFISLYELSIIHSQDWDGKPFIIGT